jgi:riboflavin kinase/FMN adenylyltransferase
MMRVVSDLDSLGRTPRNTAVTVGVFDGFHVGHQLVVENLLQAKQSGERSTSILLTFDRHPLSVTHPEAMPPLLTTLGEKLSLLERTGIDICLVVEFSDETAATGYRAFIREVLIEQLGMKHLVVGYDFHLGSGREGSQQRLIEEGLRAGFGVSIVPPVVLAGRVVSSTKIRQAISCRKLRVAKRFLGRNYFFDAEVVRGKGLGRHIGFPTANLSVSDPLKQLPPRGVYAVLADHGGKRFGGMMNIGSAPTLHSGGETRIEVHLFDRQGELYGERLRIHCVQTIRSEKRFSGPDELKARLLQDREKVSWILEKND